MVSLGPRPPDAVRSKIPFPPGPPGASSFLILGSAPALTWQLAHAWMPSPPVCVSQKNAFPSAIAALRSRTKSPRLIGSVGRMPVSWKAVVSACVREVNKQAAAASRIGSFDAPTLRRTFIFIRFSLLSLLPAVPEAECRAEAVLWQIKCPCCADRNAAAGRTSARMFPGAPTRAGRDPAGSREPAPQPAEHRPRRAPDIRVLKIDGEQVPEGSLVFDYLEPAIFVLWSVRPGDTQRGRDAWHGTASNAARQSRKPYLLVAAARGFGVKEASTNRGI